MAKLTVQLPLTLRVDEDADVIQILEGLPKGQRTEFIRRAIRHYVVSSTEEVSNGRKAEQAEDMG